MKHVIALSGGADSTAMSLHLKAVRPHIDFEYVCTPTGDELPPMVDHWRNLEKLLGKPIKNLSTLTLFEAIEKHKAIPNFRMRFCTSVIKIQPFLEYMEGLPEGSVMYVGLRADEPDRLGMQTEDDTFSVEYPMREWGWTRADVEASLACHGVMIPKRTDCGACFYQRIAEWKSLLDEYPERYQRYVEIEEQYGHTFRSPRRDTWPASLKDLRESFKERSLPKERKNVKRSSMCTWCSR